MERTFTWLHLSDLHVGQNSQGWLWPNLKSIFLKDLECLLKTTGVVDAVIFSGDLTQGGKKEEYDQLTLILKDIWTTLAKFGSNPIFFPVPGNHDLCRPDPDTPVAEVLRDWWNKPTAQSKFWSKDNDYYPHVCSAFSKYSEWLSSLRTDTIIRLPKSEFGFLPGDISSSIELNGIKIGLIGLNSAFLQLSNHNYDSQLALDVRQILEVTKNEPTEWCLNHDINFLITHHPPSWLKDIDHFNEHIYHPDRFTAHLFGHLHEIDDVTVTRGSSGRKFVQAASLFGLEKIGSTKEIMRNHGYSIGKITIAPETSTWKLWPRKSHVGRDRSRKFIPDHDLPLEVGEEFLLEPLKVGTKKASSKTVTKVPPPPKGLSEPLKETSAALNHILDLNLHKLNRSLQHEAIRGLEQQACGLSIKIEQLAWIVTDWGLGADGFLASVLQRIGMLSTPTYRIDLGNYEDREEFLAEFSRKTGCSFTEFCQSLAEKGASILILDEAPVSSLRPEQEPDAGKLAAMIKEFCSETTVLLISRSTPKDSKIKCIKLNPLDEADTREYIIHHPDGDSEATSTKGVSDIYRYTEGVPGKIDRALKHLRVVDLEELAGELVSESKNAVLSNEAVPSSLVQAVGELMNSTVDHLRKSFTLLKILSILPSGEALQRIKYFPSRITLRIEHAEELLERNLIEVRSSTAFIKQEGQNQKKLKILFSPRQVRDYVLSLVPDSEVGTLTNQAVNLYFGEKWRSGTAKLHALSEDNDSDDKSILQNAHTLILRLLKQTTDEAKSHTLKQALVVCKEYCRYGVDRKHSATW